MVVCVPVGMLGVSGRGVLNYGIEAGGEFEFPLKKTATYKENGHFFLYMFPDFFPFSAVVASTNKWVNKKRQRKKSPVKG